MTSKDSPVFVYQRIEGHAVPPASGEIVNVDVGVPNKHEAQDKSDTIIPTKVCAFAKHSV